MFNSLAFVIFVTVVFAIYWMLPNKYRWILILVSSYFFYMNWNPGYAVLILISTSVSYVAGLILGGEV